MKYLLNGLTAEAAIAKIKTHPRAETIPQSAYDAITQLAEEHGGILPECFFEHLSREEALAKPFAERRAMFLESVRGVADPDKFLKEAKFWLGDEPAYNGIVGDSHDCPACNYRRLQDADVTEDMSNGLTLQESEAAVAAGYAKTGRAVPDEAKEPSSRNRLADSPRFKALVDEIDDPLVKAMVEVFGGATGELPDLTGIQAIKLH